ncbi:MAG: GSCFA domain-containing protein [Cyanobacteria bacterium J06592_8]
MAEQENPTPGNTPLNSSSQIPPGLSSLNRWSKGKGSARDRIALGVTIPEWNPSFQIASDAKVFAIGSCFARNIEAELLHLGVKVTSADPKSELLELRTNLQVGLLNKYNPLSIHQELEWAAGLSVFPDNGLIELGENSGKYVDPYLRDQARQGSLDILKARRKQLKDYFSQAFQADLVILTLGLTETWFDRVTRRALTEIPSPRLMKQYPNRFEFKILSYPECLAVLQSVCALLKKHGLPNLKIVVTVSPVALERTFSGQDVIVANMMSKSTLRSVAGTIAASIEGVDYFPSYEAAMVSDPALVWQPDRRNVTDFIVAQIIGEFTRRYGLKPALDPDQRRAYYQKITQTRLTVTQRRVPQLEQALRQMQQTPNSTSES